MTSDPGTAVRTCHATEISSDLTLEYSDVTVYCQADFIFSQQSCTLPQVNPAELSYTPPLLVSKSLGKGIGQWRMILQRLFWQVL
ncbi:MAG: hypothetical protein OEW15_11225 [Nitrospirota bacterium]|nr:hypothetical protein [Nitrospirota bacterium]